MTQRHPREEDPAYLAYVRTLPCLVCGRGPVDAAHIRSPDLRYGKRHTGMGEKPDDCWAVPLCRDDHRLQHCTNELEWWASMGISDPCAVAIDLYAHRPGATKPPVERRRRTSAKKSRKPRGQRRQPGKSAPMAGTKESGVRKKMNGTVEQRRPSP